MAIYEKSYTLVARSSTGDYAGRAAQYSEFIKNILGEVHTFYEDDDGVLWLDESHSCGFKPNTTGIGIMAISSTGAWVKSSGVSANNKVNVYYQFSKNANVLFFREVNAETSTSSNSNNISFIAAKDSDGFWSIFHGNYMCCKEGLYRFDTEIDYITTALPFTAVKLPAFFSGRTFNELYKILSAPIFEFGGTYADFGGEPYRVVSVSGSNSTKLPSFAFPVAEEN